MNEIDKKFNGVLWEWEGKTVIRKLKPICPDCQYELHIERRAPEMTHKPFTITFHHSLVYSCPKCSFYTNTTIEDVDSPKDLRKVARKEFEYLSHDSFLLYLSVLLDGEPVLKPPGVCKER